MGERDVPLPVQRELREKVNYGCPVPSCGSPFLEWHHFDPPWEQEHHFRPEGMIALCTVHHPMADAGTYAPEQLHEFKEHPNSLDVIRAKFGWFLERSLIRLGGIYTPESCRIRIGGMTVMEINKDQNGLTVFSFRLEDKQGTLLAEMTDNIFTSYPDTVHDLSITPSSNRIKVWSAERQIGFECHYSRKSIAELEKLLQKDCGADSTNLNTLYHELQGIDHDGDELREVARRCGDNVRPHVIWYALHHQGRDGKIPVINFRSCRFYNNGPYVDLCNDRMFMQRADGCRIRLSCCYTGGVLNLDDQRLGIG